MRLSLTERRRPNGSSRCDDPMVALIVLVLVVGRWFWPSAASTHLPELSVVPEDDDARFNFR